MLLSPTVCCSVHAADRSARFKGRSAGIISTFLPTLMGLPISSLSMCWWRSRSRGFDVTTSSFADAIKRHVRLARTEKLHSIAFLVGRHRVQASCAFARSFLCHTAFGFTRLTLYFNTPCTPCATVWSRRRASLTLRLRSMPLPADSLSDPKRVTTRSALAPDRYYITCDGHLPSCRHPAR